MTQDLLLALTAFALVTSITPGPNNLMLMASSANFGFRRTIPHMLGIGAGFFLLLLLSGLGLAQVFEQSPLLRGLFTGASVVYMGWLAWRILTAPAPGSVAASGRPITFVQAAAFQWVNPKAWAMAVTAATVYGPGVGTLGVAAVFAAVNLPSVSVWTLLGQTLRRWLTTPVRLRLFNAVMALALVASLLPVLL